MKVSSELIGNFNCSIERAFKSAILGDATKFLNGYLFQPPVTMFEEDSSWGNIEGYRYPVTEGGLFMKSGRIFLDEILEKEENKYWKWKVYNFENNSLFFTSKGIGEWSVLDAKENQVVVSYKYTFYSKNIFLHPLNWLFVKIQWRGMMKKALIGIQKQAESKETFYYEI